MEKCEICGKVMDLAEFNWSDICPDCLEQCN
jgi:hypothetical protein